MAEVPECRIWGLEGLNVVSQARKGFIGRSDLRPGCDLISYLHVL